MTVDSVSSGLVIGDSVSSGLMTVDAVWPAGLLAMGDELSSTLSIVCVSSTSGPLVPYSLLTHGQ